MCINCRKAAIEDIAILGNAAVAAYNTNSANEAPLRALQRTLIEIEQLHADADLAETQKLSDQYKSDQAAPAQPDTTTGIDADKDAMIIVNGAPGIGKDDLLLAIGKALLDLGYVAEGYSPDVLLVRDPKPVTVARAEAMREGMAMHSEPQPPVEVLTPNEVEVAKLIRSRLYKVLGDLPTYGGYRELTIEQLDARLEAEINEFNVSVGLRK